MKKLLFTMLIFLLLIAGGVFYINLKGTELIRGAVEKNSSEILGAKASFQNLSLGFIDGRATIEGFTLGQPSGFGDGESFSIHSFTVDVEPMSLVSDHVKVDAIIIDKPKMKMVMRGGKNNFTVMQENVAAVIPQSDSQATIKLSIKDFRLNQTNLQIDSDTYGNKEVTLADVHLQNIGINEDGVTPEEAYRLALDALKPQIAKALVQVGIKDEMTKALEKEVGDKLKNLPKPIADKLKDGLGGLLGKKKDK